MKIAAELGKFKSYVFNYSFAFDFSWEVVNFCKALKAEHGFNELTFFEGKWRFNSPKMAVFLRDRFPEIVIEDADLVANMETAREQIKREKELELKSIEIKNKTTTDFVVEGVKGNLYDYQKVAVEFFVNNNGRVILASDIGTGKTLMSLAYMAHSKKIPALIISPASVKLSWEREVKKWTNLSTFVIGSKTSMDSIPVADVYIINYDVLKKFMLFLKQMPFVCLVTDESHLLKNAGAQRSQLAKELSRDIPHILMLSGTPLLNRPMDLFNQLNILDPKRWSNFMSYAKRYCGAFQSFFGWDTSGATNIEELKENIAKYFIRFRKEDVLKDLPPKVFIDVPVALNNGYQRMYENAMESLVDYLIKVKNKTVEDAERSESAKQLVLLNELRQITTACKAEQAKELVENIIESGEKVIVFSVFNQPLLDLQEYFGSKAVILIGSTAQEQRQYNIDQFQNDPTCQIFLGGTKASGVGITLTAASNVVFIDQPWTAADYAQAYGRAERIGNKSECIKIHQMLCAGTMDEKIADLVREKQKIFDQIFNGAVISLEETSVASDLIKQIKEDNNI